MKSSGHSRKANDAKGAETIFEGTTSPLGSVFIVYKRD